MIKLTEQQAEQIREYVTRAEGTRDALVKEAGALREAQESLQKQASLAPVQTSAALPEDKVTATVENMVKAGYVKEAEKGKVVARIGEDPAFLLDCLDKVAAMEIERNIPVKPMGKVATVEAPAEKTAGARKSDEAWKAGFERLQTLIG